MKEIKTIVYPIRNNIKLKNSEQNAENPRSSLDFFNLNPFPENINKCISSTQK